VKNLASSENNFSVVHDLQRSLTRWSDLAQRSLTLWSDLTQGSLTRWSDLAQGSGRIDLIVVSGQAFQTTCTYNLQQHRFQTTHWPDLVSHPTSPNLCSCTTWWNIKSVIWPVSCYLSVFRFLMKVGRWGYISTSNHLITHGAGSPGHGVNWPLKFEIGVKKLIPRLYRTVDFWPWPLDEKWFPRACNYLYSCSYVLLANSVPWLN